MLTAKEKKAVKEAINRLTGGGKGEIQVTNYEYDYDGYTVDILFPYCKAKEFMYFSGESVEEAVASIVDGINIKIESMIDHLSDCLINTSGIES